MIFKYPISNIKQDDSLRMEICEMLNPSRSLAMQWDEMAYAIAEYIDAFRDNLCVWIETDYIDKTYRDSFSAYFSTKYRPYEERCIRMSFTEEDVDYQKFLDSPSYARECLGKYLGFMVLRPICPGVVGRTVISPDALEEGDDLKICKCLVRTSFLGMKAFALGFPHSSQDREYSTCAETALWSLFAYFGNKYPEYTPIMPSQIHAVLESKTDVRHVPSEGLVSSDISAVLKRYGFGCKIYALESEGEEGYDAESLRRILSCYIESGIPCVVCVNLGNVGHGIVCIGHTSVDNSKIKDIPFSSFDYINEDNHNHFKRWLDVNHFFVFNDDNKSCYQTAAFDEPTPQYDYEGQYISHVIAPLYSKIYLDAPNAIDVSEWYCSAMNLSENVMLKTYLASGNTFKDFIIKDCDIEPRLKDLVIQHIGFPKFIWVTEISDEDSVEKNIVDGWVIVDATQPINESNPYPLLRVYKKDFGFISENGSEFHEFSLTLQFNTHPFSNLK